MCSSLRPVRRRYFSVSLSTGKMPQVAPYSGAMLAMVARSASGQLGDAGAVELDELADDAVLAQRLGDGENEVGGGGAFLQFAGKAEADHLRDQHGDRLAEHGGLGLDAADAPAEHAQAVDHGGVGVGADQGVGIGGDLAVGARGGGEDDAGEIFEVDLVADAHAGRHGGEVVEGGLAPFEEGVALAVALEFERGVEVVGVDGAELIDLDGVVDDQLGGLERVDLLRVAAQGASWRRAWRRGRRWRGRR